MLICFSKTNLYCHCIVFIIIMFLFSFSSFHSYVMCMTWVCLNKEYCIVFIDRTLWDRSLFSRKWLRVIINDDLLDEGECYDLALLPSIICLGRLRIAYIYIQSLTTTSGSRLFGSMVRVLDFYPGGRGSNPTIGETFFQLCVIPLLDFHVVRVLRV